VETVAELRASVHRDPRRVAEVTTRWVAAARADGDDATLSGALSVRGRARRSLGEIDLAESDLRGAVEAAAGAGAADRDELAADAHLGLAGVLSFAGRTAEAFAHLDVAHRLGSPRLRAHVELQRAAIGQRIGQVQQALAGYAAALPTLRKLGAHLDVAMVLLNRGVIRTQSGDCDAAAADLSEAGELFAREGHDFGVAQADHGLGWAYARHGDLPAALRLLDRSAERFRQLGHAALEVDVDRVEVLLAAGLFLQALEVATRTARRFSAAGNHSKAAETWLLCARASLLDGDRTGAGQYAALARSGFAAQGSVGWERAARLEQLLCDDRPGDAESLRALASELDQVGNARGAATALALACVAACEAGEPALAADLSARCGQRAARIGVFEVRMLAAYAQASCAVANGDLAGATRLVRSGLTGLRRHRASLAATDARAAVGVHAAQLASLGLQLALRRGSAPAVLEWMELARAGRGRHLPPRPPDDEVLAAELAELRAVISQVREREAADRDTADLLRAQRSLERSVHRRRLRTGGDRRRAGAAAVTAARRLGPVLDGRLLVSLAEIDGRLVGVRVGDGRTRMADLGPAADLPPVVASLMAMLRALVTPRRPSRDRRRQVDRLGRAVDVVDAVMARLLSGDGPVVLVVPAALHTVPWRLLPCLAGRQVVVAPSASWWYETQAGPVAVRGPAPVALAGPRLVEAEREATGVAGCYPGGVALTGTAATSGAASAALAKAPVVHIACHGRLRRDNPLWSSLELSDGPLWVYDVERLARTAPLVVLSGCHTGVGVRAGDELLGLSTALLQHGTRCLVASVCALPDTAAIRDTMIALHRRIGAGVAAPAALAELTAGGVRDEGSLLAAGLGCFGSH
jgi:tetratricopeptide (TPR) repeat protein